MRKENKNLEQKVMTCLSENSLTFGKVFKATFAFYLAKSIVGIILIGLNDYKMYKYKEYYRAYRKQKENNKLKVVVGGKAK